MESYELIVFYITGWIEPESSHPFSVPTDYWTRTMFDANIYRHDTRLLILWNKETILKFL